MKIRNFLITLISVGILFIPVGFGFAADFQENDPPCLVKNKDIVDAEANKLIGPLAVVATDVFGGVAEVVLRLRQPSTDVMKFFRLHYIAGTAPFPTVNLLNAQNRLCEILAPVNLGATIADAFGYPTGTQFVFKKGAIRKGEIVGAEGEVGNNQAIGSSNELVIPGTPNVGHISTVVIFAQPPLAQ